MDSLKWNRRKASDAFGRPNATTEHYTTAPDGTEYALRKSDDIFFLYIDGRASKARTFFDRLADGKAALERAIAKANA